jgi:hypothetical protein
MIASTIIEQLGRGFSTMVGAKNIVALESGVQFGFMRGNKGINKAVITLNAMDTYDLSFWKINGVNCKEIETVGDIYNDQLAVTFTSITGLDTHL